MLAPVRAALCTPLAALYARAVTVTENKPPMTDGPYKMTNAGTIHTAIPTGIHANIVLLSFSCPLSRIIASERKNICAAVHDISDT